MDQEFFKYLAGLGIGGILAAIFYYQNDKNSARFAAQIKELYDVERGRTEMLISVVKEVTVAITNNTAVTQSFHRRLDDEEIGRRG